MNILAISGSLRTRSYNTALLRAAARLAPAGITVELYRELGVLPLFNPDHEVANLPMVARLHTQLLTADGVLIASPEYAHGVSGPMKNALDWMVGTEAFVDKPVAVFNASPRAHHALEAIKETLSLMSARLIDSAELTIPLLGSGLEENGILSRHDLSAEITSALSRFRAAVAARIPATTSAT